jgi:hypothetical protein
MLDMLDLFCQIEQKKGARQAATISKVNALVVGNL